MKRLYVRPAFRGHSLELKLAEQVIAEGNAIGCSLIRLHTVPRVMRVATALYRGLGLYPVPACYDNSPKDVDYFELRL